MAGIKKKKDVINNHTFSEFVVFFFKKDWI
jgi:hypothetical protein